MTPTKRLQQRVQKRIRQDLDNAIDFTQRASDRQNPNNERGYALHDDGCTQVLSAEDKETLHRIRQELSEMYHRLLNPNTGA